MILSTRYRNLGLSKQALFAFGKSPMRFPGKFVPGDSAITLVQVAAATGADIANGRTLILHAGGDDDVTLTFHKSGGAPANPITYTDLSTTVEMAAAIVAAIAANPDAAAWFEVTNLGAGELHLRNTYNDPLGFNLAGTAGAVAATGTSVTPGEVTASVLDAGKDFVPGYIFVPMRGGHWAPAINYPASLKPVAP
jgi:hypothetical protein